MSLSERAKLWLAGDPDELTRREVETLLAAGDELGLAACFEPALAFGTAGLRGAVGAGPARINRAVVRRVAWALGQFLREADLEKRVVVVGFDARPSSRRLAEDTCLVLSGLGIAVRRFEEPCPTPFVAFACRALGAGAGVVVTASHNPRADNGYKVYDDRGMQIVAPWDERIAHHIRLAPPANELTESRDLIETVPASLVDEYFARLLPEGAGPSAPLRVAYTPLHGVGLAPLRRALEPLAVDLRVVASQAEPDGTFPTTPFPNPEEPGVVDALIELAGRERCALALANDPDADRLAVCVPTNDDPEAPAFRMLSGDEMGALLADFVLASRPPALALRPVVAASVVSSPFIEAVAASRGARVARTLTGFKWLCRVAEHVAPDEELAFAYEEALGLCVNPARVADKDGLSAAAWTVRMAQTLAVLGDTVFGRLQELYAEHGLWVSTPKSVRIAGPNAAAVMQAALSELRARPPESVAELRVTEMLDYASGADRRPPYLGEQDLASLELASEHGEAPTFGRVLVRPSGTEPKLKLYVHLGRRVPGAHAIAGATEELRALGLRVGEELVSKMKLAEPGSRPVKV